VCCVLCVVCCVLCVVCCVLCVVCCVLCVVCCVLCVVCCVLCDVCCVLCVGVVGWVLCYVIPKVIFNLFSNCLQFGWVHALARTGKAQQHQG
jgi:hypothetical protein